MYDYSLTKILVLALASPAGALVAYLLAKFLPNSFSPKLTGGFLIAMLVLSFATLAPEIYYRHTQPELIETFRYLTQAAISLAVMASLYEIYSSEYVTGSGKISWTFAIVLLSVLAMLYYLFTARKNITRVEEDKL